MKTNPLRFYRDCLQRAFAGWFKRIEGWISSLSLCIGLVLLFWHPGEHVEKTVTSVPNMAFLAVFLAVILFRLAMSPYWLWAEEHQKREVAESLRRPRLELGLPNPPVIDVITLGGTTSQSLGGTRQTVINRWVHDVVALTCINTGETAVHGCRARLIAVEAVRSDGSELTRIVGTVELPWRKEDPEDHLKADIAPGETQRIWVGGVRDGGHIWLFRKIQSLPIEYQQLLGGPGTYRVLIQVDGDNIPTQQIKIEITASSRPDPQSGVRRGHAQVAIVAQGAPRIEG